MKLYSLVSRQGMDTPFSATQKKPRSTDRGFCFSRDFEEIHSAKIVIDVS